MVFLSRLLMSDVCKQSLMSLRKSTGHSFHHCKKALQENNNDLNLALKWLEKESLEQGWSKLQRTEGRNAKEGVLAMISSQSVATLTEVRCETDFVARNKELREFVKTVSKGLCNDHLKLGHQGVKTLSWDEISKMAFDGMSVEESRARLVAKVGEKLTVHQSVVIGAPEGSSIMAKCHPDGEFGKYGAILLYKGGNEEIADKICRHVIGMKPTSIGDKKDIKSESVASSEPKDSPKTTLEAVDAIVEDETEEEIVLIPENDDQRLLQQDFVFYDSKTVGQVLRENNMEVTKFWRYECSVDPVESKD